MGIFDTVTCDYPLPDPRHQDLEFQTKDLEKVMGRPLTVEEFAAFTPEKLELVNGRIPGGEKLVMLLLTSLGLRRVAALVGRAAWIQATEDPHP